jgi:hypothetical protein
MVPKVETLGLIPLFANIGAGTRQLDNESSTPAPFVHIKLEARRSR